MLKTLLYATTFILAQTCLGHAENAVGHKLITIVTGSTDRALNTSVWYPTDETGSGTLVADNPVWVGQAVLENASVSSGQHPLVLLSHGFGGNWRNESWLAFTLAKNGYIVAAPDHPGTTTFDRDLAKAKLLNERPYDLSRVLDALLAERHIGYVFYSFARIIESAKLPIRRIVAKIK
ncbi:MAG: hypothetical protein RIR97_1698 [Pseudomonadota bacterium]